MGMGMAMDALQFRLGRFLPSQPNALADIFVVGRIHARHCKNSYSRPGPGASWKTKTGSKRSRHKRVGQMHRWRAPAIFATLHATRAVGFGSSKTDETTGKGQFPGKTRFSQKVTNSRVSASRFLNQVMSEISIRLMKWQWSAWILTLLLRWPAVARMLTPVFKKGFLLAVLRHEHAVEAIPEFLRKRNVAMGIAQLLRHHVALAGICEEPDTPTRVTAIAMTPGLGPFLRAFLRAVDAHRLARFMEHRSTAVLIAAVVCSSDPTQAAAAIHEEQVALAQAVTLICLVPGAERWGASLCSQPGFDQWIGNFLGDPRGAQFARQVLLTPGFEKFVEVFIMSDDVKSFVINLLQRPRVCSFVTWLNQDTAMRPWFAHIASRDSTLLFITEMLLKPGLDRFMVRLLLLPGNDAALRAMLEHWVRAEGSLRKVVSSFAEKPLAARALARVIVSPGFLDTFVIRRLLLQPGLAEIVVDAVVLVGVRGMLDTVLPLSLSTFALAFLLLSESTGEELVSLLEELPAMDQLVAILLAVL